MRLQPQTNISLCVVAFDKINSEKQKEALETFKTTEGEIIF